MLSDTEEAFPVKIKFPADATKLSQIMDMLWNGTFATFHMTWKQIDELSKITHVEIIKNDHS